MLIDLTEQDAQRIATFMAHSMIGGEAMEVQKLLNEIARLTNLLLKPFQKEEYGKEGPKEQKEAEEDTGSSCVQEEKRR